MKVPSGVEWYNILILGLALIGMICIEWSQIISVITFYVTPYLNRNYYEHKMQLLRWAWIFLA